MFLKPTKPKPDLLAFFTLTLLLLTSASIRNSLSLNFSLTFQPQKFPSAPLSSHWTLPSHPTDSLQISHVALHSQSHPTGSSYNSPWQNGAGFLPQISNTALTSRCPVLSFHQFLCPTLVPFCSPAFSCTSLQPVTKSWPVSLLPTSVPGSYTCYITWLLFLLPSHSFLLHASGDGSRSLAAHETSCSHLSIQCLTSFLPWLPITSWFHHCWGVFKNLLWMVYKQFLNRQQLQEIWIMQNRQSHQTFSYSKNKLQHFRMFLH